jgi:hypothetical protein
MPQRRKDGSARRKPGPPRRALRELRQSNDHTSQPRAYCEEQAFAERPEVVRPAIDEFLQGQWPATAEKAAADPRFAPQPSE